MESPGKSDGVCYNDSQESSEMRMEGHASAEKRKKGVQLVYLFRLCRIVSMINN